MLETCVHGASRRHCWLIHLNEKCFYSRQGQKPGNTLFYAPCLRCMWYAYVYNMQGEKVHNYSNNNKYYFLRYNEQHDIVVSRILSKAFMGHFANFQNGPKNMLKNLQKDLKKIII